MKRDLIRFESFVYLQRLVLTFILCSFVVVVQSQTTKDSKKISPDLFGLFFEDINYSADGGLYAELVQNRSFEYSPTERFGWNPLSYWEYSNPGFSYGQVSVETNGPLHPNNKHYVVLNVEHVGHEANYTGETGVGLKNTGFDGIVVKAGENYNFSMFAQLLSGAAISMKVNLQNTKGEVLASAAFSVDSKDWKKYTAVLTPKQQYDTASLVVLATTEGKLAIDEVSLSP